MRRERGAIRTFTCEFGEQLVEITLEGGGFERVLRRDNVARASQVKKKRRPEAGAEALRTRIAAAVRIGGALTYTPVHIEAG